MHEPGRTDSALQPGRDPPRPILDPRVDRRRTPEPRPDLGAGTPRQDSEGSSNEGESQSPRSSRDRIVRVFSTDPNPTRNADEVLIDLNKRHLF